MRMRRLMRMIDSYQDDGDTRPGAEAWQEGHHQYYSLGLFVKDGAADSAGIDEDAEEDEEDAVDIVLLKQYIGERGWKWNH
mmetsp:Transcript_34757/g.39924  ORF Transcript_34757/g.39924 Transcript_34757/m.39924 type:complete len:81 (+) Transcript_34757:1636-1878(+)